MRKLFAAMFLGMLVVLAGCTNPKIIEHQARAKATAAKWQGKAEVEKWKAVQELAKSGSDVGRATAGMAVQADAIRSGGAGPSSVARDDYTRDPSVLDYALGISREARGWAGLKYDRDYKMEGLRTQRAMRADDNATYLGFGKEIGATGRYGMDAATDLGGAAIDALSPVR